MFEITNAMKGNFVSAINKSGFLFAGRKISNLEDIKAACSFIYKRKHVLYKSRYYAQHFSLHNNQHAIDNLSELLDSLAKKIWDYFNNKEPISSVDNNQENFDRFFDDLCCWFLNELNTKVRSIVGLPDAYYGNAQKMINILFKYLVCYDDYYNYADLFSYCHIPIDNIILECFIGKNIPECKTKPGTKVFQNKGWYELDADSYWALVKNYRTCLSINANLPYLAVDFCWWNRTKSKLPLPTAGSQIPQIIKFYYFNA